ncbi:MAG TPA: hypothetical protein VK662_00080 [Acidothermaceae bacterium]|jgi:hypothetical protein|nr:hypothetical protein [Acidothermaceae bacterium]
MSASDSDPSSEDPSFDKALEALGSADLQTRIEAVEALAASGRGLENVVQLLVDEPDGRYLVFERLGRFGSAIIAPLESARSRTAGEAEFLISAALLLLGSHAGASVVLRTVEPGDTFLCLAVTAVTSAHLPEAGHAIEQALRTADLANFDELNCLTEGLRALSQPLPQDIVARLSKVEPAWRRESLLGA